MEPRRSAVEYVLPAAAFAVLALAMWPAVADAPNPVTIIPLAACDEDTHKCTMSEADYRELQDFHVRVLKANEDLAQGYREAQEESAAMRKQLGRVARGCGREHTT